MNFQIKHHYIDRKTKQIQEEPLFNDDFIRMVYSDIRERSDWLYNALLSAQATRLLSFLNYDSFIGQKITGGHKIIQDLKINQSEWLHNDERIDSARKIFERQIQYWTYRPMPKSKHAIVSPADARMLIGSLNETQQWFIKEKFFEFEELIGKDKYIWLKTFANSDIAIFRLTPDKYHYNHSPVSGIVADFYSINGFYHSCNPGAVVQAVYPYSKNQRTITIIDTDVDHGTRCGMVAMIEVTALMIGKIKQCYSDYHYDNPTMIKPGMFIKKGQPKSLYQPGSSVDILLFQPGRIQFDTDIIENMMRKDVQSRFSKGFGMSLVETDVLVRSQIGQAVLKKK